jgi:hypothetical protein
MRPLRNPDAVCRELGDGEIMILVSSASEAAGATEQAIVLNPIGTAIWHLADGERDVDAIAALVSEHYPDVDVARVCEDVAALVRQLLEKSALLDSDS